VLEKALLSIELVRQAEEEQVLVEELPFEFGNRREYQAVNLNNIFIIGINFIINS